MLYKGEKRRNVAAALLRLITRLGIWGALGLLSLFTFFALQVLSYQDWAYDEIHRDEKWIPRSRFSPEAKLFTEVYFRDPYRSLIAPKHRAHPASTHAVPILLNFTIEDETALEITAGRSLDESLPNGLVSLETYLAHSKCDLEGKERALVSLLKIGRLSPARFRELRAFLPELEQNQEKHSQNS